jgi:hypothetical protein
MCNVQVMITTLAMATPPARLGARTIEQWRACEDVELLSMQLRSSAVRTTKNYENVGLATLPDTVSGKPAPGCAQLLYNLHAHVLFTAGRFSGAGFYRDGMAFALRPAATSDLDAAVAS